MDFRRGNGMSLTMVSMHTFSRLTAIHCGGIGVIHGVVLGDLLGTSAIIGIIHIGVIHIGIILIIIFIGIIRIMHIMHIRIMAGQEQVDIGVSIMESMGQVSIDQVFIPVDIRIVTRGALV